MEIAIKTNIPVRRKRSFGLSLLVPDRHYPEVAE
jgi:hypothetical protein